MVAVIAIVAITCGSIAVSGITNNTAASASEAACNGVSIVVDFTDVGGKLEVACAEGEQTSGRDALLAAGFTLTDSQPGFLCAINSMPDPCPKTFDGSFWSYWHATPQGEWTSYQVGADSSSPAQGEIEGWRYNDGNTPPGITPASAAVESPAPGATSTPNVAEPGDEQVASTNDLLAEQRANQSVALIVATIGFVGLVIAMVLLVVVRHRRSAREAHEARD